MAYRRTKAAEGLIDDTDHDIGTVYLGAAYALVRGFQARNWASAAKAAGGTDSAVKVKLTDANGMIFYLDASDDDYKTATVFKFIAHDDTATGVTRELVDSTGAAVAAGQVVDHVLIASPVTVTVLNGGTTTDFFELFLFVEDGNGEAPTRR